MKLFFGGIFVKLFQEFGELLLNVTLPSKGKGFCSTRNREFLWRAIAKSIRNRFQHCARIFIIHST